MYGGVHRAVSLDQERQRITKKEKRKKEISEKQKKFFFNEIYYIIFQRASIENTDLSATVMIRKLLKQQKAHIQAIPVQCS